MLAQDWRDSTVATRATHLPVSDWIAVAVLVAGCIAEPAASKTPARQWSKRFVALENVSPPLGALVYCASDPVKCGERAMRNFAEEARDAESLQDVGPSIGGVAATFVAKQSPENAFRLLLDAGRDQGSDGWPQSESTGAAERQPSRVALTPEMWSQLRSVQTRINAAIRPDTDSRIYGEQEVWAQPLKNWSGTGRPRGDCEDYVLEKRGALLQLGWPPNAISIVTAMAPNIGMHAVLVVSTDLGEYVLDNMEARPRLAPDMNYSWISRQTGRDMLKWTLVELREETQPNDTEGNTTYAGVKNARRVSQGAHW